MATIKRLASDLRLEDLGRPVSIIGFNDDEHSGVLAGFIVRRTKNTVDIQLQDIPEAVSVPHDRPVKILRRSTALQAGRR
jgi:RNase P/RNase MRP subunit p29